MNTLRIHDILPDRILVSRESARSLEVSLRELMTRADNSSHEPLAATLTVDFEGVEGVAPSFIDELVLIFESIMKNGNGTISRSLILAHPPTRLSSKFEAIARGHRMSVRLLPDGSWILADAPANIP